MNKALEISGLEIGYRMKAGKVLHVAGPVDISMENGAFHCLLGPNGTGKSTLLRTLAGIQPALSGDVQVLGNDLKKAGHKNLAKMLSVVLTDRIGHANLTAYELVALGRIPHTGWYGRLEKKDRMKVRWAIEVTGTDRLAGKNIYEISDGERQKVMIARALAQDTPLILLDEPTAHLDLPNRIDIVRLLRSLARSTGKAIIMSTHELDLALQAADRIWLMTHEKRMYSGVPEDLVLNDTFARVFTKEGVTFDKLRGVFKVVLPYREEIGIAGDETGVFWTAHALERLGFVIGEGKKNGRFVMVERTSKGWRWDVAANGKAQSCDSIGMLQQVLEKEGGVS